jgi:two-component system, LytTR family, response regulator
MATGTVKARLICSPGAGEALEEALASRGIAVSDEADLVFVERGMEPSEAGICILFDPGSPEPLLSFLDAVKAQRGKRPNILVARKDDAFHPLQVEKIQYFEANGNTVYCHAEGQRYEAQEKLYELESRLRDRSFLRIGKSCIVNVAWIRDILPGFGGRLILRLKGNATELEVSRNYVGDFKAFLGMQGR